MILTCKNCGSKDSIEFYKAPKNLCKTCVKSRAKLTYYTQGGKEKIKQWRLENEEKYRAQKHRANTNRNKRKSTDPEFRKKINEAKRLNSLVNYKTLILNRAKTRAIKYNLEFNLTKKDIIIPTKCPLLNVDLVFGTKDNYKFSPSLDRIDSTKGYIPSNVKIISTLANTMKNCADREQLLTFAKNINTYLTEI